MSRLNGFFRSFVVKCLCLTLLFSSFFVSVKALTSSPLTNGNTQNGMVRVCLTSLGSPTTLNLTVYGSYSVNGSASQAVSNGTKINVNFNKNTGDISYTANGNTHSMGKSFALRRHESSGSSGIKIAQGRVPANLYPGDISFVAKSSGNGYKLYVIVSVFMEDYLYGVLPYEMGDSSGLEALKAQAVAARTYTMRAMSAASSALYDVVDTTADQVYSGTPSGSANCKTAVDQTKGIVLKNGSAFTATYYTASNGGQVESVKNIWGSSAYPYLIVKDDPYDLANPDSRKLSFNVKASGTQSSAVLQSLLNKKASSSFGSGATVTGVSSVRAHTPKYVSPSRLYTKLDFTVQYTKNGQTGSGTVTFDIFSELESQLGMSINADKNELWSVTQTSAGFTVTARRFGHGLGMSQRGAMYMAKQGYSYDQILAFYYSGCTRVQYQLTRSILSPISGGQQSQEQITMETPAPIENPASEYNAQVITESGTLNLRASASSTAAVLRTIPQNAVIPIFEKTSDWCKTQYEGTTGYVMTKFLTFLGTEESASPPQNPSPQQPSNALSAKITTPQGTLNLRQTPNGTILRTIPQNEIISVLEKGNDWCMVQYAGTTGYVMTSFLTMISDPQSGQTLPSVSNGAVQAQVTTESGPLNLRANAGTSSGILTSIPRNAIITVLEKSENWCRVSYNYSTGYVMARYLTFISGPPTEITPMPTEPETPSNNPTDTMTARVTTESGSLNLRKKASANADVISTIPQHETIPILKKGNTWCQAAYAGNTGYVMTKFLTFTGEGSSSAQSPSAPESKPAEKKQIARVTTPSGSLNLRKKANENADVLCTIPQNEVITLLSKGNTWCNVAYLGKTGYVMTKFLTFMDVSSAPAQNTDTEEILVPLNEKVPAKVVSSISSLNLRTACSLSSGIILEIPANEYVLITQAGDTWCAVEYIGQSGFCMREYLEFQ